MHLATGYEELISFVTRFLEFLTHFSIIFIEKKIERFNKGGGLLETIMMSHRMRLKD